MEVRRFAGRTDVPGIVRAHGRAWRAAYDGLLSAAALEDVVAVEPTEADVERWLEELRKSDAVLVAAGDRVVGFADFRWSERTKPFVGDDEAGLKAIYVDPDRWERGVGTALLSAGLDALPDSVERLRLEVLADNDRARRFYETRGFERTGSRTVELAGERYPAAVYTLEVGANAAR